MDSSAKLLYVSIKEVDDINKLPNPLDPYWSLFNSSIRDATVKETMARGELQDKGQFRANYTWQRQLRHAKRPEDAEWEAAGLKFGEYSVPRETATKIPQKAVEGKDIAIGIAHPLEDGPSNTRPCFIFVHGGARIGGNQYSGGFLNNAKVWAEVVGAVTVSMDYRLSPGEVKNKDEDIKLEATREGPTNDCYDVMVWAAKKIGKHPLLLDVDPNKVILIGSSAGGGIAVGAAFMWKEKGNMPKLCGIMLEAPQLDDRCKTDSHEEFSDGNMFTSKDAQFGWKMSLTPNPDEPQVEATKYEAPARATDQDVEGLPPTFLDVGTAEPFRDEVRAFAKLLEVASVTTDFKEYKGGWHGFVSVKKAPIANCCFYARLVWLIETVGGDREILTKYVRKYDDARVLWKEEEAKEEGS